MRTFHDTVNATWPSATAAVLGPNRSGGGSAPVRQP